MTTEEGREFEYSIKDGNIVNGGTYTKIK